MSIKKYVSLGVVAAASALFSLPATAGYEVLDGWQMKTPVGLTTNIGRLNVTSGNANVQQEVNIFNQVFVGAKFAESGQIFSITYTPESAVGINDVGAPSFFAGTELLRFEFSNVAGVITNVTAGQINYTFTSGTVSLFSGATQYFTGDVIGLGGQVNGGAIIGGTSGRSVLLNTVSSLMNGFDINDSTGTSIGADLLAGKVLFQTSTTNDVGALVTGGACGFAATVGNNINNTGHHCLNFVATSGGDAWLVRDVPEPTSLALVGLSLLGVAGVSRRAAKKSK